jgi:hypothetical protein
MDVTSLLNAGTNPMIRRDSTPGSSFDAFTGHSTGTSTVASTTVPTPSQSPEKIPSGRTSGSRTPNRNRTPWDAGGYSLPLTLDTKFNLTAAKPAFYNESPIENIASASSYSVPWSTSGHSRRGSMASIGSDMVASTAITPLTASQPRYVTVKGFNPWP